MQHAANRFSCSKCAKLKVFRCNFPVLAALADNFFGRISGYMALWQSDYRRVDVSWNHGKNV